jgi:multidrug efflux pump
MSRALPGERGNLSVWALAHRNLVVFFIVASAVAGAFAYLRLGRAEDPSFTFKVMTIRTEWPGASAREVERLVTDRIEKKLEEVPHYDFARSYSKPGESVIFLTLKDSTPPREVPDAWYQARKKVGDMRGTLPEGVRGPFFNDEFGDVYSAIYAFMGVEDGFSPAQMKKVIEEVRARLLKLPAVAKADLIAPQDERIYVEISSRRLAAFDLPIQSVIEALRRENVVAPAGNVDAGDDRFFLRVDVGVDDAASVRAIPVEANGRLLTVGDVAEVTRGYVEPRQRARARQGARRRAGKDQD